MAKVELEPDEWQRVMAIIAQAPWTTANPLLMKIGDQLKRQIVVDAPQGERPAGPPQGHMGARQ